MASETYVSYWTGEESAPCPTLDRMPKYVDVVPLAFVVIDDDYQLDFGQFLCKVYPASKIQQWVKKVRANGSKVLLSINDERLGSVPNVPAFVDQVVDAAVDWGVDGIDFDYEQWLEPSDTMIDVVKATRPALAKALGREPYLSAPVYSRWEADLDFLSRLAPQLDLVTTMDCPPDSGNFTPLADVEKLCSWEPAAGKKAGAMLYTFSYDVTTRKGSGTGYPDFAFSKTVEANLP